MYYNCEARFRARQRWPDSAFRNYRRKHTLREPQIYTASPGRLGVVGVELLSALALPRGTGDPSRGEPSRRKQFGRIQTVVFQNQKNPASQKGMPVVPHSKFEVPDTGSFARSIITSSPELLCQIKTVQVGVTHHKHV